jgi:hypothetical protein
MNNPVNLNSSANKVKPTHVIEKLNTLIEGSKLYNDQDFEIMKKIIYKHPSEKEKNELLTILRMFSSSGGTNAESLLSIIIGSKIEFDKKAMLVYLMKKSKSIAKISSIAINEGILEIFKTTALNPATSKIKLKNKRSTISNNSSTSKSSKRILKMAHMDLGSDGGLDPNSLGYKLRKALKIYLSRKVAERIEAFTCGESLDDDSDEESKATPEEITQKMFTRLGEFLFKNSYNLIDLIHQYVFDHVYYSRDITLIYIDDFFK